MTISIDRRIYNDSVISKAIYWLSDDYIIVRDFLDGNTESLSIEAVDANVGEETLKAKLMQTLNDFKLRQIVADETRDIKTILYAKAFAEDEDLSEEDIHD